MFKRIVIHVLMIISIGILTACATPIVPVAPSVLTAAPTTAPTATLPPVVPTAVPVEPTAAPAVAIPLEVSASPRDPGVSGTVRWGTTPVPDAVAELRTGDWRVNPDAVLQRTTTDPEGRYFMPNPPAGDFVMCGLFPEGVQERSTCTPVHIEAGQDVADIDVLLLRTVNTISPAVDEQVSIAPTLSWQSFPNAVKYEVFVIDAGTTELVQHEFVTGTQFPIKTALRAGRTYDWVVNAIAADGGLLADIDSRFAVRP